MRKNNGSKLIPATQKFLGSGDQWNPEVNFSQEIGALQETIENLPQENYVSHVKSQSKQRKMCSRVQSSPLEEL